MVANLPRSSYFPLGTLIRVPLGIRTPPWYEDLFLHSRSACRAFNNAQLVHMCIYTAVSCEVQQHYVIQVFPVIVIRLTSVKVVTFLVVLKAILRAGVRQITATVVAFLVKVKSLLITFDALMTYLFFCVELVPSESVDSFTSRESNIFQQL